MSKRGRKPLPDSEKKIPVFIKKKYLLVVNYLNNSDISPFKIIKFFSKNNQNK